MTANLKNFLAGALLLAGAGALAAGVIYAVVWCDAKYRDHVMVQDAKAIQAAETTLLEAEERLSAGRSPEPAMAKLTAMEESILSNDQMRRRLLMLGDVNMLYYKKNGDDPNQKYYYDLAAKFYERAMEYSKGSGKESERNEIVRRMAEMYAGNKDWDKAIKLISNSVGLQMLPEDRWRLKMIEAECLLKSGRPYLAAEKYASVADECDERSLWSDALISRAQILLDVAGSEALMKTYLQKDSKGGDAPKSPVNFGEERGKLLKSALGDFGKVLAKSRSIDRSSGLAKLGILRVYVMEKDKAKAYDMVNSIQASPMSMKDKADSFVMLASLHESLGEYKTAIKLLEACTANFPLTSMFIPVSMDLYAYYKKAGEWEKAFSVAERIVKRGADAETAVKLIEDFSPDRSEMLNEISMSERRDAYIDRLNEMLDKIRNSRPEAWKLVQHQAQLIMAKLFFISGKYGQAEKVIAGSLQMSMVPKNIEDELLHLDIECALKSGASPAVAVARAKRYLQYFPLGKYYQDSLAVMLDGYYELKMYDMALDISKKLYVDDLMKRAGKKALNPYWLKTVARIGECYERLGKYDRANMILRDNATALMDMKNPAEVFKAWSDIAVQRGQILEAIRRIDIILEKSEDLSTKADLIVARYLLQLKVGSNKDFDATKRLLQTVTESKKLEDSQKQDLRRELYKGLLEYAFKSRPSEIRGLLDQVIKGFSGESWPQYWILLSLSKLYGSEELDTLSKEHEATLKNDLAFRPKDSDTVNFIKKQMDLINALVSIDERANKLKTERDL